VAWKNVEPEAVASADLERSAASSEMADGILVRRGNADRSRLGRRVTRVTVPRFRLDRSSSLSKSVILLSPTVRGTL
jgi:hypothetical protein